MPDDWEDSHILFWKDYMNQEITRTAEMISRIKEVEHIKDKLTTILSNSLRVIGERTDLFVPIHGDLSPTNIIVSDSNSDESKGSITNRNSLKINIERKINSDCSLIRLLDFERAQIADRIWEYAYYYGWLQRINFHASQIWKDMVFSRLNKEEKKIFDYYIVVFHAWTVRDRITYNGDQSREVRATQSMRILNDICH